MKVIYKYKLMDSLEEQDVLLPAGYKILTFQVQQDYNIVFWALVDTSKRNIRVTFKLVYTGVELKDNLDPHVVGVYYKYCATVQTLGLVYHIFRKQE